MDLWKVTPNQTRVHRTEVQSYLLTKSLDIFSGTGKQFIQRIKRPILLKFKTTRFMLKFWWPVVWRYEEQSSQPIILEKCRIYRMEMYGRDLSGNDHISVGMRRPNGDFERPILRKRLFWTKPGISVWFCFVCILVLFCLYFGFVLFVFWFCFVCFALNCVLYLILFSIIYFFFHFFNFCIIIIEFLFVSSLFLSKWLRNVVTFFKR